MGNLDKERNFSPIPAYVNGWKLDGSYCKRNFPFSSFKISIESWCFATEIHFLIHFYLITSTGLKNASIGHIFNRQKIKRENSWFIFWSKGIVWSILTVIFHLHMLEKIIRFFKKLAFEGADGDGGSEWLCLAVN